MDDTGLTLGQTVHTPLKVVKDVNSRRGLRMTWRIRRFCSMVIFLFYL